MKAEAVSISAIKWSAAVLLSQWASVPTAVHFLIAFMALDVVSGFLAAFVQKKLSSTASLIGITKKVLILVVVLATHLMERAFGLELGLEKIAALGYTANEALSIIENCGHAGVWVPPPVLDALAKLRGATQPTHPASE